MMGNYGTLIIDCKCVCDLLRDMESIRTTTKSTIRQKIPSSQVEWDYFQQLPLRRPAFARSVDSAATEQLVVGKRPFSSYHLNHPTAVSHWICLGDLRPNTVRIS